MTKATKEALDAAMQDIAGAMSAAAVHIKNNPAELFPPVKDSERYSPSPPALAVLSTLATFYGFAAASKPPIDAEQIQELCTKFLPIIEGYLGKVPKADEPGKAPDASDA